MDKNADTCILFTLQGKTVMKSGLVSIVETKGTVQNYPPHTEKHWEIVIYTQGEGKVRVGKHTFSFMPGTIVYTPPGFEYTDTSFSDAGYANYTLHIDQPLLRSKEPLVFQDQSHTPFLQVTRLLHKEFYYRQKGWEIICNTLLDVLQYYLASWSEQYETNPVLEKLKHLLIQNIHNSNFCLNDAIRSLSESATTVHRLFKKATGMSPMQYLIDIRIREARNLLSYSDMSVKEIAYKIGFNDPYYFSRLFKKKVGTSPAAFRSSLFS